MGIGAANVPNPEQQNFMGSGSQMGQNFGGGPGQQAPGMLGNAQNLGGPPQQQLQ